MGKKIKIISFSILAVVLIGFAGYSYIMHGGERNLSTEDAAFTVSSKKILAEFVSKTEDSNKKYLEKAVAVTGVITHKEGKEITIDNSIICSLKNPNSTLKKDQNITVKGRVVGYDDLMGELKLDQCFVIVKN
jgi:hypothetical protein